MLCVRLIHTFPVLLSLCLLTVAQTLPGQERALNLIKYDLRHGIPEQHVTSMATDKFGFLWLATTEGLYRFDGQRCTKVERFGRLSNAYFTHLLIDADGALWAGTQADGLVYCDITRGTMRHYVPDSVPGGLPNNRIKWTYQDDHGRIWVATHISGINLLDRETGTVVNYRPSDAFETSEPRWLDEFTTILTDPVDPDMAWIGSLDGLLQFNLKSGEFGLLRCTTDNLVNPEHFNGFENKIREIRHSDGILWITSYGGGLTSFNPVSKRFHTHKHERVHIASAARNNLKNIVVLPDKRLLLNPFDTSLLLFDPASRTFQTTSLPRIFTSYQDGNIAWFAGYGPFLYAYTPAAQGIVRVNMGRDIRKLFSDPATGELYASSLQVEFLGINEDNNALTFYDFNPQQDKFNAIKSAHFRTGRDAVLVGGYDVYCLDHTRQRVKLVYDMEDTEEGILSSVIDHGGNLWLGRKEGLYRIDAATGEQRRFTKRDGLVHGAWITDMLLDSQGHIWYGTEKGFGCMRQDGQILFNYPYDPGASSGEVPPLKTISRIVEDPEGRIWIADADEGIAVFQKTHTNYKLIERITPATSALASDRIDDMLCDSSGNIWVITPKGLSKVYGGDFEVENYGREHGLGKLYYLSPGAHGQVYIGGQGGYYRFDPASLKPIPVQTRVILESLTVYDKPYHGNNGATTLDSAVLGYRDGFFTIGFRAINFFQSEPVEYQYKMVGLQDDWISNGDRRYVSFAKIDGGTYTFSVRARSGQEPWSDPRHLYLRMIPPFWETAWFYIAMCALLGSIGWWIYKTRLERARREERIRASFEKKLAETEMTALRAQMNPHFLFNCLNSIKLFTVENDTGKASRYLTKFSRLIRLILQNSNAPTVRLSDELEALRLYIEMEAMRFDEQFTYEIRTNGVPTGQLEIPPLVLQPYVENAIWHGLMHKEGDPGHLIVDVSVQNGHLYCTVEDNGVGVEAAKAMHSKSSRRKKSYGMSITRDRLSLIRKLYEVDAEVRVEDLHQNGLASGTRVTVRIPVMQAEETSRSDNNI